MYLQKVMSRKTFKKLVFRWEVWIRGSKSGSGSTPKMLWIRNTALVITTLLSAEYVINPKETFIYFFIDRKTTSEPNDIKS